MKIIDPVIEGKLGDRQTKTDPVAGDVRDVIEENPTDREIAELFEGRGMRDALEDWAGTIGLEGERDKACETARFVLKITESPEMVHAVRGRFDVPIQHRACAPPTHFVPSAMNLRPLLSCFLPLANLLADLGIKDLGASASDRPETMLTQEGERVVDRSLEDAFGKMTNLHGSKGFDDEVRCDLSDGIEQFQIPLTRERGMQAPNHVDLCNAELHACLDLLDNLGNRQLECMGLTLFCSKRAELTGEDADV